MPSILIPAIIFLCFTLPFHGAYAGLNVLEGEHTVTYDIVNPRGVAFIPDYANESFSQTVVTLDEFSKRVKITSKMSPLKTRVAYPIPAAAIPEAIKLYLMAERDRQSTDASIVNLARQVTQGNQYAHEAANSILSWIADNLTFDASLTTPSDALSALKLRKAYCVGYSNLAVAMLRAAGIPARIAHGYLPPGYEWGFTKNYWGVKVNDGGFHAYIEIFYPDTGWVFSDAEHSHHFVDPFHIILRLDGMEMSGAYKGGYLDVDKATFYTIFQEENRTFMVDELPLPKEKRLGRRLDNQQHAALITGSVKDATGAPIPRGTVVLWKEGKGVPSAFNDGHYASTLQNFGKYRVDLKGSGFAKSSREIQVEQGHVYQLDFTLLPGGVIIGKVVNFSGKPVIEGDVFYRDGNSSFGVSLDKEGNYVIEGLAPGHYKVFYLSGDKQISHEAQVDAGKTTTLDFITPY